MKKSINHRQINITDEGVYADPCEIIPRELWGEYCDTIPMGDFRWDVREFRGLRFKVKRTGGDGVFHGACVNSGTVALFPHSALEHDFGHVPQAHASH